MLRISVHTGSQLQERLHDGGPLEIGRGPQRDAARLIVNQPHVSRDHVRLTESVDGLLQIENISRKNPILLNDTRRLDTTSMVSVPLPVRIRIGSTTIQVDRDQQDNLPILQTVRAPLDPRTALQQMSLRDLGEAPSVDQLTAWLERAMRVQRAASGSPDFFSEAAQAVVDLVGLSSSCVLLRHEDGWRVVARYPLDLSEDSEFSHSILNEVVANRRTYYETFRSPHDSHSLRQVEAVVASPILDEQQQLVGVLYGSRRHGTGSSETISPLEAQFVQLLATAVGAGLVRQQREVEAARLRVQFEQFFSPVLAAELERDPRLLEAREREISMLFVDVRGFSGMAERIEAQETFRFMGDVFDRLTSIILDFGGVIIDYYGDGVAVMWNAPLDQPRHARVACQAALALLDEVPALSGTWSQQLGQELALGIGIHTGTALVGNSGSRKRLKYGPRGHTVNLASRLEQATKQLGVPVLLSEHTAALLDGSIAVQRICKARLYGMAAPMELYTLAAEGDSHHAANFEQARQLLDRGRLTEAEAMLASMAGAGHTLAARLLALLQAQRPAARERFDGAIELYDK